VRCEELIISGVTILRDASAKNLKTDKETSFEALVLEVQPSISELAEISTEIVTIGHPTCNPVTYAKIAHELDYTGVRNLTLPLGVCESAFPYLVNVETLVLYGIVGDIPDLSALKKLKNLEFKIEYNTDAIIFAIAKAVNGMKLDRLIMDTMKASPKATLALAMATTNVTDAWFPYTSLSGKSAALRTRPDPKVMSEFKCELPRIREFGIKPEGETDDAPKTTENIGRSADVNVINYYEPSYLRGTINKYIKFAKITTPDPLILRIVMESCPEIEELHLCEINDLDTIIDFPTSFKDLFRVVIGRTTLSKESIRTALPGVLLEM